MQPLIGLTGSGLFVQIWALEDHPLKGGINKAARGPQTSGASLMMQKQRSEYLSLRRSFEPAIVTLVIVAESPPISGKYFYDPSGEVSEPLFDALMKQIGIRPKTKPDGLCEFQRRGWVLVDATYEAVNAHDKRRRDSVIARDYPELLNDLNRLLASGWNEIPLILIKANVCTLLGPKLKDSGFNVLNEGRIVYFPGTGHQRDFDVQFREIVPQTLRCCGLSAEP